MVMMRKDHPAAGGFNLEKWLAFPHVLVSGRGHTKGDLDDALAAHGRERRVGIVVPSFLMVPPLLVESNLIAVVVRAFVFQRMLRSALSCSSRRFRSTASSCILPGMYGRTRILPYSLLPTSFSVCLERLATKTPPSCGR